MLRLGRDTAVAHRARSARQRVDRARHPDGVAAVPVLQWMTWWHFHPEMLAVPALLFAWWLRRQGALGCVTPSAVVRVVAVKEDAALVGIALGLVVAIRNDRKVGLSPIGAVVAVVRDLPQADHPARRRRLESVLRQSVRALGNVDQRDRVQRRSPPEPDPRVGSAEDRREYWVKMFAARRRARRPGTAGASRRRSDVAGQCRQQPGLHPRNQVPVPNCGVRRYLPRARRGDRQCKTTTMRGVMVGFVCACALATSLRVGPVAVEPARVQERHVGVASRGHFMPRSITPSASCPGARASSAELYDRPAPHAPRARLRVAEPVRESVLRRRLRVKRRSIRRTCSTSCSSPAYNADDQLMFEQLTSPGGEFR